MICEWRYNYVNGSEGGEVAIHIVGACCSFGCWTEATEMSMLYYLNVAIGRLNSFS